MVAPGYMAVAGLLCLDRFDAGDSLAGPPRQIRAVTLASEPVPSSALRLTDHSLLSGNLYMSDSSVTNLSSLASFSLRTVRPFHGNVFSSRPVHLRRNSWDRSGRRLLPQVPRERIAVSRAASPAFTGPVGSASPAAPAALSLQYTQ